MACAANRFRLVRGIFGLARVSMAQAESCETPFLNKHRKRGRSRMALPAVARAPGLGARNHRNTQFVGDQPAASAGGSITGTFQTSPTHTARFAGHHTTGWPAAL